jgi:diaminopimelate epimerase
MQTAFTKYEGLGNDFIVIDAADERAIDPVRARALCDRHFGIGADGILFVLPPSSAGARAKMVVVNADGTRPEMCGNGIRCVALHLAGRDRAEAISYVVDTDAGPLLTEVEVSGDHADVRVAMGNGRAFGEHRATVAGREVVFLRVSMGNPHAVAFDVDADAGTIDGFSPRLSADFEGGTNVEFARTTGPNAYDLVVWERGVGRTLACGTGAAATAVAAVITGRADPAQPIFVRLPGGPLELRVDRETLEVRLRGPARRVFSGVTCEALDAPTAHE